MKFVVIDMRLFYVKFSRTLNSLNINNIDRYELSDTSG